MEFLIVSLAVILGVALIGAVGYLGFIGSRFH